MIIVIIILAALLLALLLRPRRPADPAPTVFEGYRPDHDLVIPGADGLRDRDEAPHDTSFHPGGGDFGGGGASGDWSDGGGGGDSGD